MGDIEKFMRLVSLASEILHALVKVGSMLIYPKTKQLLEEHKEAIIRIGDAAYASFKQLGLESEEWFTETVVLSAQDVRRLFGNRPSQT